MNDNKKLERHLITQDYQVNQILEVLKNDG